MVFCLCTAIVCGILHFMYIEPLRGHTVLCILTITRSQFTVLYSSESNLHNLLCTYQYTICCVLIRYLYADTYLLCISSIGSETALCSPIHPNKAHPLLGWWLMCWVSYFAVTVVCPDSTFLALSLHHPCTILAPSLHLPYTFLTPSSHLPCTIIAPSLHLPYTFFAPSLHLSCICTFLAPSLYLPYTFLTPSLHLPCNPSQVSPGCFKDHLPSEWS